MDNGSVSTLFQPDSDAVGGDDGLTTDLSIITTTTRLGDGSPNNDFSVGVMDQEWLRVIFIVLYCLIFLVGVGGNVLVIFIVLRNKAMQTITNIFITNLAVSDILICIFAVPFTPLAALMDSWIFGEALCYVVPMIMSVNVFVSTLTSIAIAVDRYLVIVHPFKPRIKIWLCIVIICVIWFIAVCTSLPISVFMRHDLINNTQKYECYEQWPVEQGLSPKYYGLSLFILQYVFPCIIIVYCYLWVGMVLQKRSKMKIGSKSQKREQMEIRRKRKTNRMLISMIAIFICCWMPLNSFHLAISFLPPKLVREFKYFILVFFITHVIAMSSTIYNPFLYAFMNDNFRKEFRSILPCCFRDKKSKGSSYTTFESQLSEVRLTSVPNAADGSPPLLNGSFKNGCKTSVASYDTESEKIRLNAGHLPGDCECV